MAPATATKPQGGQAGWRKIAHYAYVERPYEDVWNLFMAAPRRLVGDETTVSGSASPELHVFRGGIELSRTVRLHYGGLVCTEERARLAVRWEDGRHPRLFPVLEGVLELVPLASGPRQFTQVGLVGRYRPPFGPLGGTGDRVVGSGVAAESVAWFVEDMARRIEEMVEPQPEEPQAEAEAEAPAATEPDGPELRRVFLPLDGLHERAGGAAGVSRQLSATPGVVRVDLDPVAELAEIEYDPSRCSPDQLVAELESEISQFPSHVEP